MSWVSIVMCSHNKPIHCREAINSIINQTFQDWKCVIYDSGILFDQNYFSNEDIRIEIKRSEETEEIKEKLNVTSWLFNRHKLDTEWILYFCDDDLLHKNALQEFYDYAQKNPKAKAMYGHGRFSGPKQPFLFSKANYFRGKCVSEMRLDNAIDGGQCCLKSSLIEKHKWSEKKEDINHSDGIFLESIGEEEPFHPIDALILHNRKISGLSRSII